MPGRNGAARGARRDIWLLFYAASHTAAPDVGYYTKANSACGTPAERNAMATFIWLGIAIVFGIVEALAPALVCLWFCLGAAVTFVVSFFVDNVLVQIAVFLASSLVLLLALRPFMRKRVNTKPEDARTNADAYVGRDVVVTQRIPEGGQCGRVLLADVSWLARTADGSALSTGSHATVAQVDSTVLVVKPAR